MRWKSYRESLGSPAKHEVVICHDSRDTDHPFIKDRVALYEKAGKKVTVKAIFPGAKNDSKKDKQRAGRKAVAPIIEAQARRQRSVAQKSS